MEIKFKALKFEAGEQLAAFVDKKVSRLSRFCEGLTEEVEVALEDHLKQGKLATGRTYDKLYTPAKSSSSSGRPTLSRTRSRRPWTR